MTLLIVLWFVVSTFFAVLSIGISHGSFFPMNDSIDELYFFVFLSHLLFLPFALFVWFDEWKNFTFVWPVYGKTYQRKAPNLFDKTIFRNLLDK